MRAFQQALIHLDDLARIMIAGLGPLEHGETQEERDSQLQVLRDRCAALASNMEV